MLVDLLTCLALGIFEVGRGGRARMTVYPPLGSLGAGPSVPDRAFVLCLRPPRVFLQSADPGI